VSSTALLLVLSQNAPRCLVSALSGLFVGGALQLALCPVSRSVPAITCLSACPLACLPIPNFGLFFLLCALSAELIRKPRQTRLHVMQQPQRARMCGFGDKVCLCVFERTCITFCLWFPSSYMEQCLTKTKPTGSPTYHATAMCQAGHKRCQDWQRN